MCFLACLPVLDSLHLRPNSSDSHRQLRMSRWPASVGAAAIAKGLALAPRLRFLDLSRCGIRAKGLAALSDALRQGGALQVRLRMSSSGAATWVAVVFCWGPVLACRALHPAPGLGP